MIHTPWKVEFQSDEQGFGVIDATGRLVAAYADMQAAHAIRIAMNKTFPPGSPQCRAPGTIDPGYSKAYEPDPRKPRSRITKKREGDAWRICANGHPTEWTVSKGDQPRYREPQMYDLCRDAGDKYPDFVAEFRSVSAAMTTVAALANIICISSENHPA